MLNLKGALDASADLLGRLTTNWRAGCEKFACPVRREGRSLSFVPTPIPGQKFDRMVNSAMRDGGEFSPERGRQNSPGALALGSVAQRSTTL